MDSDETFKAIQYHYLRFIRQNQHERGQVEKIIESLLLGFLFLVSFLANGTICTVLLQANHRQTASSILLLSLIFADFFISLFIVPFVIVSVITDEWLFGSVWCEMSGFLVNTLFTGSNLSIVAIAIHRYYFVVKPLAVKIDVRRAHFIVGLLWFSSLTCAVPPLFGWNSYAYSPGKAQCTLAWESGGSALVYSIYYDLTTFFVPLGIILFVYKAVYSKAKKRRKLETSAYGKFTSDVNTSRARSIQSVDQQKLPCGCFSRCTTATTNNNIYIQRQPISSISSISFSFDSCLQNIPVRHDRKEALRRQVSRHSSIIRQRTFQSVSAIVASFIVCLAPYFVLNLRCLFTQSTPNQVLDFVTSFLYLSITAVNPMTYGYSNRQLRRAVKRLPLIRRYFRQGRDRAYQMDRTTHNRPATRPTLSQRNEALDNES